MADAPKPTTAFLETMYVGTDRLERVLTDAERRALSSLLRKHDFVGASLIALRYALKLRSSRPAAQDLQDRANLRLVRQGWDPNAVTLVKCLCRFVWSEHHNVRSETAAAGKAADAFLREQGTDAAVEPSIEERAIRTEAERQEKERGKERIASLRAAFADAKDDVNLEWLDYTLAGVDKPAEMARLSGRDVAEFYRAAERRKRHIAKLLAAKDGEGALDSKEKK